MKTSIKFVELFISSTSRVNLNELSPVAVNTHFSYDSRPFC
jgi:hypothetical protein